MKTEKQLARITGILYLLIMITAGFSEGVVRSKLVVPGDPVRTANQILSSEFLFRLGFVTDLSAFMLDIAVSVLLYVLLKNVNQTLALVAAAFRLLAHPAIAGLNMLNHYAALQLLEGGDFLGVFQTEQLESLALLFLNLHETGYLIAGAFFGVHLLLLGILLYRSELFPSLLGILILLASLGYLIESFGNFLLPGNEQLFTWLVAIPAVLGEFSLTLWLLVKGVRTTIRNVLDPQ